MERTCLRGRVEKALDRKNPSAGFAMTEMLLAILVVLVLIAGSFIMVSRALSSHKVAQEQQAIVAIRMSVQQVFAGQSDYAGLTTSVAEAAEVFPSNMLKGAGNVQHSWGGTVDVDEDAGDSTRFTITYHDLPQVGCLKLAVFGYGDWEGVTVNGAAVPQSGGGALAAASAACVDADTNVIIFTSI